MNTPERFILVTHGGHQDRSFPARDDATAIQNVRQMIEDTDRRFQNIKRNTAKIRRWIDNLIQLVQDARLRVGVIANALRVLRVRVNGHRLSEAEIVTALAQIEARAESLEAVLWYADTSRHRRPTQSSDKARSIPAGRRRRARVPAPGPAAGRAGRRRKRRNLVYLCCLYSHADPAVRQAGFEAVCQTAAVMIVSAPVIHSHPLTAYGLPCDWRFWEPLDRTILSMCDSMAVLTLDGWKESCGVQAELAVAEELGLPIEHISPANLPMKDARQKSDSATVSS